MRLPRRIVDRIKRRVLPVAATREPDFVIGGEAAPYMLRWWLIPRNRVFNLYLHRFLRSDDDRALHDHPWLNCSLLLEGAYTEHTIAAGGVNRHVVYSAGELRFRGARTAHRVELHAGAVWTLFITGPVMREWGFHCPHGWRPWQEFVASRDKGQVGRGCE